MYLIRLAFILAVLSSMSFGCSSRSPSRSTPDVSDEMNPVADGGENQLSTESSATKEEHYKEHLQDRLVREESKTIKFQASFSRWLTFSELRKVVEDEDFVVVWVHVYLPDLHGGSTVPLVIDSEHGLENIEAVLEKELSKMSSIWPELAEDVSYILEDTNRAQVGGFQAIGNPSQIKLWWAKHAEVRFVQPMTDSLDAGQWLYRPGEEL